MFRNCLLRNWNITFTLYSVVSFHTVFVSLCRLQLVWFYPCLYVFYSTTLAWPRRSSNVRFSFASRLCTWSSHWVCGQFLGQLLCYFCATPYFGICFPITWVAFVFFGSGWVDQLLYCSLRPTSLLFLVALACLKFIQFKRRRFGFWAASSRVW